MPLSGAPGLPSKGRGGRGRGRPRASFQGTDGMRDVDGVEHGVSHKIGKEGEEVLLQKDTGGAKAKRRVDPSAQEQEKEPKKARALSSQEKRVALDARLCDWEKKKWDEGFSVVAGTDEAGRGPLAGPVVAGAFAVLPEGRQDAEVLELLSTVADSKAMNALQREEAFAQLTDPRFHGRISWAVGEATVAEIDETDILRAALSAMARAVQGLNARPDCVLVDGCNRPPQLLKPGECWTRGTKEDRRKEEEAKTIPKLSRWFAPAAKNKSAEEAPLPATQDTGVWIPRQVEAVIEGDAKVPAISAASILAKVHRDRLMAALHESFPLYGFASHNGYGTEEHMLAIKAHGPCPHHRRSFGPVRQALNLNCTSSEHSQKNVLTSLCVGPAAARACETGTPSKQQTVGVDVLGVSRSDSPSTTIVGPVVASKLETPPKLMRSSAPKAKPTLKGGKKRSS